MLDKGEADDAIRPNLMKTKRQLVILRPVLRSNKARAKLLEIFAELIAFGGLSTTVYRNVDNNKLKSI